MWTRAQVARRLGKSIATVRRMEGSALHPWLDAGGVHRFSPEEVEALRLRVAAAPPENFQSVWFQDLGRANASARGEANDECAAELEIVRKRLCDVERELAHAKRLLCQANARERALTLRHNAARGAIIEEVQHFIDSISPSQLGRRDIARIVRLVRSLQSIDAALT